MNKQPIKRRSRITHRPRIETVDKSKTLGRFLQEQFIRLAVFGIPLAGLALWGNGQLAVLNMQQREREYQRTSWERLENAMMDEMKAYNSYITASVKNHTDDLINISNNSNNWKSPERPSYYELQHIIQRVRLYGHVHRNAVFIEYCDLALSQINTVDMEWKQLMLTLSYEQPIDAPNTTFDVNIGPNDNVSTGSGYVRFYRNDIDLRLSSCFDSLANTIDTLSLLIFDPNYLPSDHELNMLKRSSR